MTPLAMKVVTTGMLRDLGELHQLLRRVHADDAVPGQDERRVRGVEQRGHFVQLARGSGTAGRGSAGAAAPGPRSSISWTFCGNSMKQAPGASASATLKALRTISGMVRGMRTWAPYLVMGLNSSHQVDHLVADLVQPGGGRLAGDGHQRGHVHVGVGHAGHQVGGAGAQGGEADARPAGEPSVHVGHEGGALFVPGGDELDGAAVDDGVDELERLFARNPEDVLHALVLETPSEKIRGFHSATP